MQQNAGYQQNLYRPPEVIKYEVDVTWKLAWGLLWRWFVLTIPIYTVTYFVIMLLVASAK